jgi:hypothetical protein
MDTPFIKRIYRIPRAEIGYLRFILEGYDGLAFARTLDRHEALVEVAYPPSRGCDAERLLEALSAECSMTEAAAPPPELYAPI